MIRRAKISEIPDILTITQACAKKMQENETNQKKKKKITDLYPLTRQGVGVDDKKMTTSS